MDRGHHSEQEKPEMSPQEIIEQWFSQKTVDITEALPFIHTGTQFGDVYFSLTAKYGISRIPIIGVTVNGEEKTYMLANKDGRQDHFMLWTLLHDSLGVNILDALFSASVEEVLPLNEVGASRIETTFNSPKDGVKPLSIRLGTGSDNVSNIHLPPLDQKGRDAISKAFALPGMEVLFL
jgi:hypothetical protein